MVQSAKVTSKGQVVIPLLLRRKLGIHSGTVLKFYEEKGALRVVPVTHEMIDANFGFTKTKGKLLAALMEEKKLERER